MSGLHAHARTEETDRLCLEWAKDFDPGDGMGPLGEPGKWEEVTKDIVLAAFAAGRVSEGSTLMRNLAAMSRCVGLLVEASQLFRSYEAHHRAKMDPETYLGLEAQRETLAKADVNRDIAERIEGFLYDDTTPRDRIGARALTLIHDLHDMFVNRAPGGEASWQEWFGPEAWSSYSELRRALDATDPAVEYEARNAAYHAARRGDRIVIDDPHPVDGEVVEALRQSFEGTAPDDGRVDAAVELKTGDPRFDPKRALTVNGFGFVPAPVVISALKYPFGDVRNDTGGRTRPSQADPSHDCPELPKPCVTVEATVDGLFPGDEGYRRAEAVARGGWQPHGDDAGSPPSGGAGHA